MKTITTLFIFLAFFSNVQAQEQHHDTTLRNNVRVVLTPIMLTGELGSFTMGYERLMKRNQSMSVGLGHLKMPTVITTAEGDPVQWINNVRNTGFTFTFDYRFYFARNKYAKPDGLYWAPYFTYSYMDNKAQVKVVNTDLLYTDADLQLYANLAMAGVQLGYQFVLGNRWTIDLMLIGPGIGYYEFSILLDVNAETTGDADYIQAIYDVLVAKYPGIEQLFNQQRLDNSGNVRFGGGGFRYGFQVGYRF